MFKNKKETELTEVFDSVNCNVNAGVDVIFADPHNAFAVAAAAGAGAILGIAAGKAVMTAGGIAVSTVSGMLFGGLFGGKKAKYTEANYREVEPEDKEV